MSSTNTNAPVESRVLIPGGDLHFKSSPRVSTQVVVLLPAEQPSRSKKYSVRAQDCVIMQKAEFVELLAGFLGATQLLGGFKPTVKTGTLGALSFRNRLVLPILNALMLFLFHNQLDVFEATSRSNFPHASHRPKPSATVLGADLGRALAKCCSGAANSDLYDMQLARLGFIFMNVPPLFCGFGLSDCYLTGDVHPFKMEDVGILAK